MAIAGRVAIVPKGEWSQSVTYDKLDLVTYNGNTFIAYKSSVGVEPVDGDTWMLVMQGIDPQDIENIIDGTTPVGDSNKLGGKGASEYALLTALAFGVSGSKSLGSVTSLNELDNYYGVNGYVNVEISGNYQKVIVISGVHNTIQISLFVYSKILKFRWSYYSGDGKMLWSDWSTPATAADLANYLPKNADGSVGTSAVTLTLKGDADTALIRLRDNTGANLGALGVKGGANKLIFRTDTNDDRTILHTGNKPTGTYTGNGSATGRSISTGGIGNWIAIYGADYMILVSVDGAIYHAQNSESVQALPKTKINFINGTLAIASDSEVINSNGRTYTYQVL